MNTATKPIQAEDFAREVYGVLGIPVDVTDTVTVMRKIRAVAVSREPLFISTANLNFLVTSQSDAEFRESLLLSDLCTADGMPIIWIAKLLGVPIKERVAGSDLFEALKSGDGSTPLKVFLFGGEEGAAAGACNKLNAESGGIICEGSYYPGFGTANEMSTDAILDTINSSNADFLLAALGAKKGQSWLLRNHDRLRVPVRAHLGAVVNFQAGTVKRAPAFMRKLGLEWLWRIKEEPQLWRRYWFDGIALLQLLLTRVVPLLILAQWHKVRGELPEQGILIERSEDHKSVILTVNGAATVENVGDAATCFQDAAAASKDLTINFTGTRIVDTRFIGLLLVLNKQLKRQRFHLTLTGLSPRVERIFRLNGFGFLLRN